jgi:hypothetical protein
VKRICEKRDQGFTILSQAWREEAECDVIAEEGQLRSDDWQWDCVKWRWNIGAEWRCKSGEENLQKKNVTKVLQFSHWLGDRKRNVMLSQKRAIKKWWLTLGMLVECRGRMTLQKR